MQCLAPTVSLRGQCTHLLPDVFCSNSEEVQGAASLRLTLEQAGLWAALLQLREQQLPALAALWSERGQNRSPITRLAQQAP